MRHDKQALTDVLEMVEAGTLNDQPHRGMPMLTAIYKCTGGFSGPWSDGNAMSAYNGSLDAAKELHDAVLPDWRTTHAWGSGKSWYWNLTKTVDGKNIYGCAKSSNPARAWLIAILKALIAKDGKS